MTLCIMKKSHFKAWSYSMRFERHALEQLARQKGVKLKVGNYLNERPISYYVFPPGVTSVPYGSDIDDISTRKVLEALPDIDR